MGVLSDSTMGKAEKNLEIRGETARDDFLSALASETEQPEPELDERLDITVDGDSVSINGDDVQNVTSSDFSFMQNEASAFSQDFGQTKTEYLNKNLKEYTFESVFERAFEQWLENVDTFVTFLKEHGDEYPNLFMATLDYSMTKYEMGNMNRFVANDMMPNMEIKNVEFPFESREQMDNAVEDYMAKHPDASPGEALDKVLEHYARQAVGMDKLFSEIHQYKKENDVETFREARHAVMQEMVFQHVGLNDINSLVDDYYDAYVASGGNGDEFDFDSAFREACLEKYNEGYNSQYFSATEFTDNMANISNDVDKISDKLWRNLNEMKDEIKEELMNTARQHF